MKLWNVTNGYQGYSDVHVLVVAPTEREAQDMAATRFKSEADAFAAKHGSQHAYDESYWTNMTATLLCDDLEEVWVSEIRH